MQRKKSTKCYIALLTGHHKISVHDAAIYHELPGFSVLTLHWPKYKAFYAFVEVPSLPAHRQ